MRVSCVRTVTVGRIDDDVRGKQGKSETGGRLGYLYFSTRHDDSRALNSQSCQRAATRTATVAGPVASWRRGPGNASASCSVCTHVNKAHRLQAWLHGTPVFRARQLLAAARGPGGVSDVKRAAAHAPSRFNCSYGYEADYFLAAYEGIAIVHPTYTFHSTFVKTRSHTCVHVEALVCGRREVARMWCYVSALSKHQKHRRDGNQRCGKWGVGNLDLLVRACWSKWINFGCGGVRCGGCVDGMRGMWMGMEARQPGRGWMTE